MMKRRFLALAVVVALAISGLIKVMADEQYLISYGQSFVDQWTYASLGGCVTVQNPLTVNIGVPTIPIDVPDGSDGWTTVTGGCLNGNAAIAVESKSLTTSSDSTYVESITLYLSQSYSTQTIEIISGGASWTSSVNSTQVVIPINSALFLNNITIEWDLGQSCTYYFVPPGPSGGGGAVTTCPILHGVLLKYLDPTATPGGSTPPPPTSTFYPTVGITNTPPPSVTFVPTSSSTPPGTLVASPFNTPVNIDTCTTGPWVPCGTMPFPTLNLPAFVLPSPTLVPINPTNTAASITATPVVTATPAITNTITSTPTNTPLYPPNTLAPGSVGGPTNIAPPDQSNLNMMATLAAGGLSTFAPIPGMEIAMEGTPTGLTQFAQQLGSEAGQAISFVRSAGGLLPGPTGGFVVFLFGILAFSFIIEVVIVVLPFIILVVRFILEAVAALKPF